MQPPAGDHVCRGKKKKECERGRERRRDGANPDWMVAAARSQALAEQTLEMF